MDPSIFHATLLYMYLDIKILLHLVKIYFSACSIQDKRMSLSGVPAQSDAASQTKMIYF